MCTRTLLVLILSVLGLAFGSAAVAQGTAGKPNIVIVFMDNFGYGEPGFNGGGITRGTPTPNMDKLAAEGLRLTNFNVEVQCTPSRAALMTGRYGIRSGNATLPYGGGVYGLTQWEITMPEMLSDVGYGTAMFGKWHLGNTAGRFPNYQGFDEWYGVDSTDDSVYTSLDGFAESGLEQPFVWEGRKGQEPKKVRPYNLEYRALIDADLTTKAVDYMTRQAKAKKPFFLYVPYTLTHFPTMPNPKFVGKTGKGAWADTLLEIDTNLGQLEKTVDDLGIRDNTIFVFTADNGPEVLAPGNISLTVETAGVGTPGPWRGGIITPLEGGLRVPFSVRWPGKIAAGSVSNEIVHAMDLFPTFAKITGGKVPSDRIIDGLDMTDFFTGKTKKSPREGFIVYVGDKLFGVKWHDWKLLFKEMTSPMGEIHETQSPQLFNVVNDPQETQNVLFPNTWVPKAALHQLESHVASLRANPPVPTGAKDPYQPPK